MLLTLHDPRRARGYYACGAWQDDTLYGLLRRHAAETPDAWAIRDSGRRLTWRQLAAWADAVAGALHAAGVHCGERVCVWLPNRVETAVVLLACSRNGYVCNPSLHHNHTVAEVAQLMERIRAAALFAQRGYGADAARSDIFARAATLSSLKVSCDLDASAGPLAFPDPSARTALPEAQTNPDQIVYLAFTSGTTGQPKGVLHSDNTLLANGRAMVADWQVTRDTVLYSHSPLSHHIGTVAIEQSLVAGCELVLNDVPHGQRPLDWMVETGATYVMGVPTHAIDVLADMSARGLQRLGRVGVFYMAGATIPPAVAQAFLDMGVKPQNVYGMTENGSHQYTLPGDDARVITETCGRACAGYETRIWDAENPDRELGVGEVGEIGTRGALLMLGYFGNQFATEASFNAHGWFMSGDLGRLDERGNLSIVGRKKDLIIRGGHNIHPATIENLAVRHPAVAKAAAFPIADERLGERVCLAVIAREGACIAGAELLAHLHENGLSRYDMPEYFIALDALPLTPSGKILKRELVEWARTGRVQPTPVRWTGAVPDA